MRSIERNLSSKRALSLETQKDRIRGGSAHRRGGFILFALTTPWREGYLREEHVTYMHTYDSNRVPDPWDKRVWQRLW